MKTSLLALLSTTLSIFTISSASAQALYWDPSATGPGTGGSSGGSGNWDQVDAFWYNGISTDSAWVNANNNDAYFTNTAGTVTLTENITAADIYFTNVSGGSYTITNATGAEQLTIGSTVDTGGSDNTIAAPINNSSTFYKNGAGRLYLPVTNNISGTVVVNQGELSVENIGSLGTASSVIVTNGATLELNSGTNNIGNPGTPAGITSAITLNGQGITNSGALRNLTGVNVLLGQVTLGQNNTMVYADPATAVIFLPFNFLSPGSGPPEITDNGSNYNLIVSGSGSGNVYIEGPINIGGSLIISNKCFTYLNGISTVAWHNTYIAPGGQFFVENTNSFGTPPPNSTVGATNTILDGGTLTTGGTYTMFANSGITVTTNGGTFICNSGTWTPASIYNTSNSAVTFTANGSSTIQLDNATGINFNLGMAPLVLTGGNVKFNGLSTPQPVFSNFVENACTFTFNYDVGGGTPDGFGTVPNVFCPSNIWCNGGQLHMGHSSTLTTTRGIYVTSSGVTLNEVTSSGTATWGSTISGPGTVTFQGSSAQTQVLSTNNTYGGTVINASTVVKVGSGGAFGTLGTGNTANAGALDFNRTGTYSYAGVISGAGIITNLGSGVITLTGKNTYTGFTMLNAGTLLANTAAGSSTGTGAVTVNSGAALGGTGAVAGPVTVASGGKLSLGLSTLTISNNLTLNGNVTVLLNKSLSPSSGEAVVTGTLTGGSGTISITNLGPSLAVGDTFAVFNKAVTGSTMTIAVSPAGVTWNNNLAVDGTISVASIPVSKPIMNQLQVNNGNLIFSVTNVSAGTYYELSTTNIETPLNAWIPIATNTISGNQFFITNPINPGQPQQYFIMQTQ